MHDLRHAPAFPNVSARWLISALGIVLLAIVAFAWLILCWLYWQGSWQFIYHPTSAITRTPASVNIRYEPVRFAATETGAPQLFGWWIPATDSAHTVLYLHGADGNLSDTLDTVALLHSQNLSILAFDYRGYGQSTPVHPSEKRLLEDSQSALDWLIGTRHVAPGSIVVYGSQLGANVAMQLAARHGALAGVVLDELIQEPLGNLFSDPRSRLVPAHLLVQDRYDSSQSAQSLKIPSLWLIPAPTTPPAYQAVTASKTAVNLPSPVHANSAFPMALKRWLDDLAQ